MFWRVGTDFKKKANSEFHTLCSYVLQTEMLDMQQHPLAFKQQFWKYKTKMFIYLFKPFRKRVWEEGMQVFQSIKTRPRYLSNGQ